MGSTGTPAAKPSRILDSPRARRRLYWTGGGVAVVAVVVFVSVFALRGSGGMTSPLSTVPAQLGPHLVKAPPDPAAYTVAHEFITRAVTRENLDAALPLVSRSLRGGLTRKQWDSGKTTVVPYPASNAAHAGFQVVYSYTTEMLLSVVLVAKPGAKVKPQLEFYIGLQRKGGKRHGPWLVDSWTPNYRPAAGAAGGGA